MQGKVRVGRRCGYIFQTQLISESVQTTERKNAYFTYYSITAQR